MRHRSGGGAALAALLLLLGALPAVSQTAGKLFVRPFAEALFPLDTYADPVTGDAKKLYSTFGLGFGAYLDYAAAGWLLPFVRGEYLSLPFAGGGKLAAGEGDLGFGLALRPSDRLGLRLDAMGGMASLAASDQSGGAYALGARLSLAYRLTPAFSLSASGGYHAFFGTEAQILSALGAGIYASYDLSALGGAKSRAAVEDPKLDAVFPSLYAYYDDNAFGSVRVVNREDAKIRDVRVSFNASRYMDQPKLCAEYPEIARGESVTVPVKALFSDSVLQITQGIDAKGEILVEYSYLGSDRATRVPIDFRMHHRNAITWSDDRRAAAFVSPTNPAALWFSKYAAGTVRDRLRGGINKPLQYAIGMFEAERLYGLNYVVVPANDYSVKHGLKDYIDSVQFPHQTLSNRGGDCSDLAILFATLMQSVGVEAAFITIPGHIFAAFDTGMTEAEARAGFYDPGLLVYRDGRAWIPVEVTMVRDGFIKAWRVAAKEWYDSSRRGTAAFYPLPDCWKVYPPAAFPGVNPRFVLPSDADAAIAFDGSLDRYVAREMEPRIEALRARLAEDRAENRANELGILYAHYGMLKDSWKEFSDSAKGGCQAAWTNLGNVAYLRKDYRLALSYYQWAYKLNPSDDDALLGIARCQYELEDFDSSDSAYASLNGRNPALAGRFGYLASIYGGEGRAWSLAERFASTSWVSTIKPAPPVAAAPLPPPLAPLPAPAPVVVEAPPAIAKELPSDRELAKAEAESAAQRKAAVAAARVEVAISPSAPPPISSELPADLDIAAKKAAAVQASAPAPKAPVKEASPVAPPPKPDAAPAALVAAAPVAPIQPPPQQAEAPQVTVFAPTPQVAVAAAPVALPPKPDAAPAADELLFEGFGEAKSLVGAWVVEGDRARQTDGDAFFAKLATPLIQDKRSLSYSFVARSSARGRGWVGVGMHLFTPGFAYTSKGYGAGDSLCVWLTRDPAHYGEDIARLQLYRSKDDWTMGMIGEVAVPESIYDDNRFDVRVDPAAGTVSVSLNGTERLAAKDLLDLHKGLYVVFRALDTAEFSAFRVEAGKR
jgi:tetratricopeptide (TPR) repeat protein